jgi:hypothetical protein
MSTHPGGGQIFFLGNRSFRSWRTIRGVLVRVAVSAAAFSSVAIGLAWRPPLSGYLLAVPWIGGAAALALAASLLTAFGVAKVDQVVISNRGVKCGDGFWDWQCVRAFRARRGGASRAIRLVIWTGEDKGSGRSLAMDERITPERARELVRRVGEYCSANNLTVKCEASC